MKKRFIVRKYVMADTAAQAIKREKRFAVDDVWIDDKWVENNPQMVGQNDMGFNKRTKKK